MTTYDRPMADEANKAVATFIAMHVRNSIENFHIEHLTDAQTRELNPLIGNAIFEALVIISRASDDDAPSAEKAQQIPGFTMAMVPNYWEEPALSDELARELGA